MECSFVGEALRTPLSDRYDVIIAGGGAAGLIAAVAAARGGAHTLLLERQGCLGGVATSGYVAQFVGFFNHDLQAVWGLPYEFLQRIEAAGGSDGFAKYTMAEASASPVTIYNFPFNPEIVKIVADEFVEEAGVDTLLHCQVVEVIKQDGRVTGVIVETVDGRCAFGADVVVDATGDATVAHRAGMPMQTDNATVDQRQPTSLVFRLSNVDVKRFRAIPRAEKRALVLAGLERGELFWESLSFMSTPGGYDAICLMSRIRACKGIAFSIGV
ncbi:MAG: FAD-dependent oxidoreductase [Hyphomicrobiales bacterium]|nr:FAD-dependent oxidoreductase [Hyphomicrobiales bacterium]